jgi:hypothetical protein
MSIKERLDGQPTRADAFWLGLTVGFALSSATIGPPVAWLLFAFAVTIPAVWLFVLLVVHGTGS